MQGGKWAEITHHPKAAAGTQSVVFFLLGVDIWEKPWAPGLMHTLSSCAKTPHIPRKPPSPPAHGTFAAHGDSLESPGGKGDCRTMKEQITGPSARGFPVTARNPPPGLPASAGGGRHSQPRRSLHTAPISLLLGWHSSVHRDKGQEQQKGTFLLSDGLCRSQERRGELVKEARERRKH